MYQQFSEKCLHVMTAADDLEIPPLDIVHRLPTVRMDLIEQYKAEKTHASALRVLRHSARTPATAPVDFEQQLPDVVTGQNQDWRLWRVDFYVARLKLYYVKTSTYPKPQTGDAPFAPANRSHSYACAYLLSPVSIGLEFSLPEMDWCISYEMNSSSPTGCHTVKLTESIGGKPTGGFTYNIQQAPDFKP